jgi:hypothetical protein
LLRREVTVAMARIGLVSLSLWILPFGVHGQSPSTETRDSIFHLVTAHAAGVASIELRRQVRIDELLFSSDQTAVEEVGARSGMRIGSRRDVIRCEMPGRNCESLDGSQAGLEVTQLVVDGSMATVIAYVWFLYEIGGNVLLSGTGHRLHLARVGSAWRVERVQSLVQREE